MVGTRAKGTGATLIAVPLVAECVIGARSLTPPNNETTVALLTGTLGPPLRARGCARALGSPMSRVPTHARRSRRSGSPTRRCADSRIGHRDDASGNGYFVALAYREMSGATFAGLTIGYSIDIPAARSTSESRGNERAFTYKEIR